MHSHVENIQMSALSSMFRRTAAVAVAAMVVLVCLTLVPAARADFEITGFDSEATNREGSTATQAGSHPFQFETSIALSTTTTSFLGLFEETIPEESPRNIDVELPAGFIGNPIAAPQCTMGELEKEQLVSSPGGASFKQECPIASQVGLIGISPIEFTSPAVASGGVEWSPLYNLVPPPGAAAAFGFSLQDITVTLLAGVRDGGSHGDYGVTVGSDETPETLPQSANRVIVWGVPASHSHDVLRGDCLKGGAEGIADTPQSRCESENSAVPADVPERPFLRNPTSCAAEGEGLESRAEVVSWGGVVRHAASFSHQAPPNQEVQAGITGCSLVPFTPGMMITPDSEAASSPTGLGVDVTLPQVETPGGIGESDLKRVELTLPEGMNISPSLATGLEACSDAQFALHSDDDPSCPLGSKIGTVSVTTPLLREPLEGSLYVGSQQSGDPTSGQMYRLFMLIRNVQRGVSLKLVGGIKADPVTGQLTTVFDDNPQLPFSELHLQLKSGARAPLTVPSTCGAKAAIGKFTSWSGKTVTVESPFEISGCGSGKFAPRLQAGAVNPVAGSPSPFALRLTRTDSDSPISAISLTLPRGELAKLRTVPYCPDSALSGISEAAGTAAAQLASPSCPAASEVGTLTVGAGPGTDPFYLKTGKVYLAGPYKGAPLSLAVVTPALAGPFDLGTVVVRNALHIDPTTAQVTSISDPLPTILHGIPLDLRDIRVSLDRADFTRNPTSCDRMRVDGTIGSTMGTSADVSSRFQVGECAALGFKPQLSLRLKGKTRRASYPALTASLRAKKGQANIGRVSVTLPHSEFLAQEHIRTVCTRVQFSADACPKASIYGYAEAKTPLLDKPLKGPVYLRANGGERELPDLVAALNGQIDIDLVGYIDSHNGGIRTTFQRVPDAPVSRFTLQMKGGRRGLLVNSTNLCGSTNRATVKMDGQNGKVHDFNSVLADSCGRKGTQ
jgi:hypothetical protein